MVGHVRHLLVQPVGRVRHGSPWLPPAKSTVNRSPQAGHLTAALVWPSVLILRYRSCRKARSDAKRFSTTEERTSSSTRVPSRVMTRAKRTKVSQAGLD